LGGGDDFDRDWFWPRGGGMVGGAFARGSAIGAVTMEKVERIRALYPSARVEWTPNSVDVSRWELLASDRVRREEIRGLLRVDEGARVVGLVGGLKAEKRIPFWWEAVREAGHGRMLPTCCGSRRGCERSVTRAVVGRKDRPRFPALLSFRALARILVNEP